MDNNILSKLEKEFKHINNKEITNLKYNINKYDDYDILNITFNKDNKHISVSCNFNYILYKLHIEICIISNNNPQVTNLSYSNEFLTDYNTNRHINVGNLIIKEIFKQISQN